MIETKLVEEILSEVERTEDTAAGKMLQAALMNRLLAERAAFHDAACTAECARRRAEEHCGDGCDLRKTGSKVCGEVLERVEAAVDPAGERELKGFHAIVAAARPKRSSSSRKNSTQA